MADGTSAVNVSSSSLLSWKSDVIPAKAGIQFLHLFWTPAFAGVTAWATQLSSKDTKMVFGGIRNVT